MPATRLRLVLDTNVLLAGLASAESPASRKVVEALEARKAVPLLSLSGTGRIPRPAAPPGDQRAQFKDLTPRRSAPAPHRFRYVADEYRTIAVCF